MASKSIQGSQELAKKIRSRRNEMGFTIEAAAKRAGVGTKTWCRYEAGESIREDKYRGVCKALNWNYMQEESDEEQFNITECRKYEMWSDYIEENYGEIAAASLAIGSDLVFDYVKQDLEALSKMPRYSHIGQIEVSFLECILPQQFYVRYDYEFLYALYITIYKLRQQAKMNLEIVTHSVLEELAIYLMVQESEILMDISDLQLDGNWQDWVFDLFGDMDIVTCLYSNIYLTEDNIYHFDHWMDNQFWQ